MSKEHIDSLTNYDMERTFHGLRNGARTPAPNEDDKLFSPAWESYKCAMFEVLLSRRLALTAEVSNILNLVFLRKMPLDSASEVRPLFERVGYMPPGIIALCFHPKVAVRTWALRNFTKFVKEFPVQQHSAAQVLQQVLKSLRENLGISSRGSVDGYKLCKITLQDFVEGFHTILPFLSGEACGKIVCAVPGTTILMLSKALARRDNSQIVQKAADNIAMLTSSIMFLHLFHCDYITLDALLMRLVKQTSDESIPEDTRNCYSNLAMRILSSGLTKGNIDATTLNRVLTKLFTMIETSCENLSRTIGPTTSAHSPGGIRRRAVYRKMMSFGAFILHLLFDLSAPNVPLERPGRVAKFVIAAVRADPEGDIVWSLLRRALTLDCFNVVQCTSGYDTAYKIAQGATRNPEYAGLAEREDDQLSSDLCVLSRPRKKDEKDIRYMTYNSSLWSDIHRGVHLESATSAKTNALEIMTFLQIHRTIGCVNPDRLSLLHNPEEMNKVKFMTVSLMSDTSQYICESLRSMQMITFRRLKAALSKADASKWIPNLSFHVMHLFSSQDNSLHTSTLETLLSKFNASSATISGRRTKTALLAIKRDPAQASSFAYGFVSASQVLSHWCSSVISASVYVRYFQWYRSILDAKLQDQLFSTGASEWILGVIYGFLQSWKRFEKEETPSQFQEICCRFFGILRETWDEVYGKHGTIYGSGDINHRLIKKWISNVQNDLLDMHALKNMMGRSTWVQTVVQLASSWSSKDAYREKLAAVINEQCSNQGPLTIDQCEDLAKSAGIYGQHAALCDWRRQMDKQKQIDNAIIAVAAKKKAALRNTKIEDHFKSKDSSVSQKSSINPASTSKGSRLKTAAAPTASKATRAALSKLKPSGKIEKPSRSRPVPPPPKSNNESKPSGSFSRLGELRKEHRQRLQETPVPKLRAQQSVARSSSESIEVESGSPKKTKFELIREAKKVEFAKMRKEAEIARQIKARELAQRRKAYRQAQQAAADEVMIVELPPAPKVITVPTERRGGSFDPIEKVFNSVVRSNGEFATANAYFKYEDSRRESFRTVGHYVKFWQPLLREEFRASITASMRDESAHFNRYGNPCRLNFTVEEVPEFRGLEHFMTLGFDVKDLRDVRTDHGGEEFHPVKVRANDIIFLEAMMPTNDPNKFLPSHTSIGLVQNMTIERGRVVISACVSFGAPCDTPNKGRRVRVSRLCTSVTFQRQIEAIYNLGKMPDGILWPILEPKCGWENNMEAVKRGQDAFRETLTAPCNFVDKLLRDNVLNPSQGDAIKTVVRACGPVFKPQPCTKSRTENNHGGITLIQGPPGTGKTSTIVALLSTLLFANKTNTAERWIGVDIEGVRHNIRAPPVRILVCAPSNGAVDEIMTRVVSKGLVTPNGSKACPRVIRVGVGSTKEELQALELRKYAGIDELPSVFDEAIAASDARRRENLAETRQVNEKISPLDKKQKALRKRLLELADQRGQVDELPRLEECKHVEQRLNVVSDALRNLHRAKQSLHQRLDDNRESTKELEDKRKRDNDLKMAKVLNSCVIVFATLSSSGNEIIQRLGAPFDVTVVDEAAQCVEADVAIPVTAGRRGPASGNFSHLVMVGDQKQLPATVLSEDKSLSARMGCSLFQRFSDSAPEQVHMLNTQYRMHPKISVYPNRQFYQGLLLDGTSISDPSMMKPFHQDNGHRFGPLTFIDTKKAGFRENHSSRSGSVGNAEEALAIVNAITALVRLYPSCDFTNEIAILSPYREQVYLIKRQLRRDAALERLGIEVNTVDGIQGREKSIVFLSTVRGKNAKSIGFVRDDRRMNVALTRAKHSVIIFGNGEVLSQHSTSWEALVRHCTGERVRLDCSRDACVLFPESRREHGPRKSTAQKETPTSPMVVDGSPQKRSRAEAEEVSGSTNKRLKGNDGRKTSTPPHMALRSVPVKDGAPHMALRSVPVKHSAHLAALRSVPVKDGAPHTAIGPVPVKDPPNVSNVVREPRNAGPTARPVSTPSTTPPSCDRPVERDPNVPSRSYSTVAPGQHKFRHESSMTKTGCDYPRREMGSRDVRDDWNRSRGGSFNAERRYEHQADRGGYSQFSGRIVDDTRGRRPKNHRGADDGYRRGRGDRRGDDWDRRAWRGASNGTEGGLRGGHGGLRGGGGGLRGGYGELQGPTCGLRAPSEGRDLRRSRERDRHRT